jgi:hypothetical protein
MASPRLDRCVTRIIIGAGEFTYEWVDQWPRVPNTETGSASGRTHGVVVLECGDVMVFNQAQPAVLRYTSDGRLINARATALPARTA